MYSSDSISQFASRLIRGAGLLAFLLGLGLALGGVPTAKAAPPGANKAFRLGDRALKRGNFEEAADHYRQSWTLGGKSDPLVHYHLALALDRGGRPQEAKPHWNRVSGELATLHKSSNDPAHIWMSCYALARVLRVRDARDCYDQFLTDPKAQRASWKARHAQARFRRDLFDGLVSMGEEAARHSEALDMASEAAVEAQRETVDALAAKAKAETERDLSKAAMVDADAKRVAVEAQLMDERVRAARAERRAAKAEGMLSHKDGAPPGTRRQSTPIPAASLAPRDGENALTIINESGERIWLEWALLMSIDATGLPRVQQLSFGPLESGRGWWVADKARKVLGAGAIAVVEVSHGRDTTLHYVSNDEGLLVIQPPAR